MTEQKPLTLAEQVLLRREAAHVRRCHVVPHHGEYTVGLHSHNAVSLLLVLFPDASRELILAVHRHDYAERWVGDMPSPAKWWDAELGSRYLAAEKEVFLHWELGDLALTEAEKWQLAVVDVLELYLWCCDQGALGNQNTSHFFEHIARWMHKNQHHIPHVAWEFWSRFEWKRMPERRGE